VAHADLVIHLRDVSSPMNELQKNSVLKILDELKFKENFSANNMIEVWNKVDLLNDYEKGEFQSNNPEAEAISCITGQGVK
jgi:GTP-binding protein HflX